MLSLYYALAIGISIASFTSITIISKAFLNKRNSVLSYKSLVPTYLVVSAAFALMTAFFISGNLYIPYREIAYIAVMGLLYTIAAYLYFFSLQNEKAALIGSVTVTQFIILSFFSAILFVRSLIVHDIVPSLMMLVGVLFLSVNEVRHARISKFVMLALVATFFWVVMWLLLYATIPSGFSPFVYYAWLAVFAAVFSAPIALLVRTGRKTLLYPFKSRKFTTYIAITGMFNGVGSVVFSFAYNLNAVYSPLLDQIVIPLTILFAFLFFRERVKFNQLLGASLVILAVVVLVLL